MSTQFQNFKQQLKQAIAQDGGLAVFRHYGFEPNKRPQKVNPFREERNSSFFITEKFGKIIFKDFGDDSLKGDCHKFVQLYEQVDYPQALEILCQIYKIGFPDQKHHPKKRKKAPLKPKSGEIFEKKLLEIQFKPFSEDELHFWWEKGKISPKILLANGVKSVQSFKIKTTADKIREFKNLSFVFAYEIVPQEAYKLYMPKPEHRVYAPAKTVFLPGLQVVRDKIHPDYHYAFGIPSLKPNHKAILCAGEPDCLALKSAGYNAFTLGDERADIPEYVQHLLQEKDIHFEKNNSHAVLYDTDFTGLKASYNLSKKYGVQRLILPKLSKQKSSQLPKPAENDVCDYLRKYGWDADLHLLLNQENFQNQDYQIPKSTCFEVEKYLSEKTEILARFIQKHKRIQTDADAGIGKTYTLLTEIPKLLPQTMLFVVPFAIQVEQIEQEYREKVPDLVCFHNANLQNNEETAIFGHPTGKVNVCTYDRIKSVYERLQEDSPDNILVVVDESHLLTSEYAYRTCAIHDVLEVCNRNSKIVYLSATPDYSLCRFSGFELIRFKRRRNPKIFLRPVDYSGEPKKALLQLLLEDKKSKAPKIVRLNNKTLAKLIARLLIAQGMYKEEEIDFVFSEKRVGVSTPTKASIVNQALIPEKVKLLFVTACFDCGINIQNTKIDKIISFETRHTDNCKDTFKQLIARFRNLEEIQVWVCKPERYREYPALKSKVKLYESLSKDAQSKLELLPYNDAMYCRKINNQVNDINRYGLNTPKTPKYIKNNQDISATHKLLTWDKTTDTYQVNYNYIRFTLKDYERRSMNSTYFYTDICKELPQVHLLELKNIQPNEKEHHTQKLEKLLEQEKEHKKERIQLICKAMQNEAEAFFDGIHATYRDQALREKIKKLFSISPAKKAPQLEGILQNYLENPKSVDFNISDFDEEINRLSHRYFFLQDLLIPQAQIPKLLEKFHSEVNYGILTKTLINHINLYIHQKTAKNASKLIIDRRKLEDIRWLELLKDAVKDFEVAEFHQKKSKGLKVKLEALEYDLKILQHQKRNLFFTALDYLEKINQGMPLKSQLRSLRRKLKSMGNKVQGLKNKIHEIRHKIEQSVIRGFEVQALSEQMNQLKTHTADRQSTTTNLRLLSSLFEVKTQKRAVLQEDHSGKKTYVEKNFLIIGKELSFEEALHGLGFSQKESRTYLEYLDYQVALDLHENLDILSKIPQKSTESSIIHVFPVKESSDKPDFRANDVVIIENEWGYPQLWDEIKTKETSPRS